MKILAGFCLSIVLLVSHSYTLTGKFHSTYTLTDKEHPIDVKTNNCLKGTANVECYKTALTDWDKELNKNYQAIVKLLKDNANLLAALKASQLSWIQHRDKEFLFIDQQFKGLEGTMYPSLKARQKVEIVRNRTLELQRYLDYYANNN